MIKKVYYLDSTEKNYHQTIRRIKKNIPCLALAKPVELDFVEWTFELNSVTDIPKIEKMLSAIV